MPAEWKNQLYYGDNLNILRQHIPDESIDLIYLDPPFNSEATYNVLFVEKDRTLPASQVKAFKDSWHWNMEVEATFQEIVTKCPKREAQVPASEESRQIWNSGDKKNRLNDDMLLVAFAKKSEQAQAEYITSVG